MSINRKVLIGVNNLTKTYQKGRVEIFRELNFDIYEGEVLGVVGESGCGKTTLIRSLLCLEDSVSGKVKYKGINLLEVHENDKRDVIRKELRYIYQHPESSLNPGVTIGKSLINTLKIYKSNNGRNDLEMYLELVGLPKSYKSKYPKELSGGEKRRAVLARALITKPKAIFADEPFSGLDKILQARLINRLITIQKEQNLTLILISHDKQIIQTLSDRVMELKDAKLLVS